MFSRIIESILFTTSEFRQISSRGNATFALKNLKSGEFKAFRVLRSHCSTCLPLKEINVRMHLKQLVHKSLTRAIPYAKDPGKIGRINKLTSVFYASVLLG